MQQKVQFATALIHEPELVILDEPWSGLDPINAEVLREAVDEVRASGRTVLFSTHQMEQAEKLVDHVCIIAGGKKLLDGRLDDIRRREAAEGMIALDFVDAAARTTAEAVLADRALVADRGPSPAAAGAASCEVKLAEGATAQRLLAALVAAGAQLRRFEVVVPTLHQIFVDRVGAAAAVAERRPEAAAS
jgi:ABC-2 type transport system ATP-binding protein